jgi:hypothetical protein
MGWWEIVSMTKQEERQMEKHIIIQVRAQEVANAALLAYYHPHDAQFINALDTATARLKEVLK